MLSEEYLHFIVISLELVPKISCISRLFNVEYQEAHSTLQYGCYVADVNNGVCTGWPMWCFASIL